MYRPTSCLCKQLIYNTLLLPQRKEHTEMNNLATSAIGVKYITIILEKSAADFCGACTNEYEYHIQYS